MLNNQMGIHFPQHSLHVKVVGWRWEKPCIFVTKVFNTVPKNQACWGESFPKSGGNINGSFWSTNLFSYRIVERNVFAKFEENRSNIANPKGNMYMYIIYISIHHSTRVLVFHCPGFEYDRKYHMNSFPQENLVKIMYDWENFRNNNSFSQLGKLGKNRLSHVFIFFLTSKTFKQTYDNQKSKTSLQVLSCCSCCFLLYSQQNNSLSLEK